MPELFGVCVPSGLEPKHLAAFERIAGDLSAFLPGRIERRQGPWYAVATLSRHAFDEASIASEADDRHVRAWAGTPPEDATASPSQLVLRLGRDGGETLRSFEPRFSACVVDEAERVLWVGGDRYGLSPLYYAIEGDLLVFATKFVPLLRCGLIEWRVNARGVLDLLTFEHLTGDRTLADRVRLLPPRGWLRASAGEIRLIDPGPEPVSIGPRRTLSETAERLYQGLRESVGRSLPPDKRVAVTLSGGMDSRALLHCALSHGADVVAFTFGNPGSHELRIAERVAATFGVRHEVHTIDSSFLPRWLDFLVFVNGGMVGAVHSHILSLVDSIRATGRPVLDGMSGDAILGTHITPGMAVMRSADRGVALIARHRFESPRNPRWYEELLTPDFAAEAAGYDPFEPIGVHFRDVPPRQVWQGCHAFDLLERQRRCIQFGPQCEQPFFGVETPFFGLAFKPIADGLRFSELFERRAYLAMYRRHLRSVARLPDADREVPLSWPFAARMGKKGIDVARRKLPLGPLKRKPAAGITNYPRWFREELGAFLEERLLDDRGRLGDLFRRDRVEDLIRKHRSGEANYTRRLGCLLALSTWRSSLSTPTAEPASFAPARSLDASPGA